MTNTLQSLVGASREELEAALQLLALSIVQHRARCGFVEVRESAAEMPPTDAGLHSQGLDILKEALEVARGIAMDSAANPASAAAPMGFVENRKQLRINVRAPVKVLWDRGGEPIRARLENISWGGAALQIMNLPANAQDKLWLLLPSTRGGEIEIEATLLRTWDLENGQGHGLATRFSSMSTKGEEELEKVLERLVQSSDHDKQGQREHARLSQRLDIEFDDSNALQAALDDISAGGLGITVPEPLEIGQSLQAVISTLDGSCNLTLRAKVVRQNVLNNGSVDVYHAGLQFEHPSRELRDLTNALIQKLTLIRR